MNAERKWGVAEIMQKEVWIKPIKTNSYWLNANEDCKINAE